ncbi:MAG: 3-dehydroquinate synthase II [Candidatus Poseidoniaceae archaeon]|jgi:3-dehydroquinate synthase II|nr:3-dehydroquinate synthase II [Candidatus Poseidoniaceae archaeon]
MEVWLDYSHSKKDDLIDHHQFDKIISETPIQNTATLTYSDESLYLEQKLIGTKIIISDSNTQNDAKQFVGSVDWIVLEFEDWSMIPIENLVAASQDTPTKIAAKIRSPEEAQGAGFALETGVDALIVENNPDIIEAALIVKSQRGEKIVRKVIESLDSESITISAHEIKSIEQGGVGERYCIDLTSLLSVGEGMLIGSSASSLVLVHGETLDSKYVPQRPFRVNSGPPHSYVMMADGTTKYISELKTNDSVLISNLDGKTRIARIGRLKIEKRPFLAIYWHNLFDKPSSIFLQQAETVRLINSSGELVSVTSLKVGDIVLGWNGEGSRHIGESISSKVEER